MILKPEQIKEVIRNVSKRKEPIKGYIPAAVLLLFFEKKKQSHLVYIRRTQGMNIHSGHMAFPGGKIDPEDESNFATGEGHQLCKLMNRRRRHRRYCLRKSKCGRFPNYKPS